MRLWRLIPLVSLWTGSLAKLLLRAGDNSTLTLATNDYFASTYPAYDFKQLGLFPIATYEPNCRPVLPDPANITALHASNGIVFLADIVPVMGHPVYCHDYRQLGDSIYNQYASISKGKDMPPLKAVLFGSTKAVQGRTGSPLKFYMADAVTLPNDAPTDYIIAHIGNKATNQVAKLSNATLATMKPVLVDFSQEIGAWNQARQSATHKTIVAVLYILAITLLVLGIGRVVRAFQNKDFNLLEWRHVVFSMSLLGIVCMLAAMAIVMNTAWYYFLTCMMLAIFEFCYLCALIIFLRRLRDLDIHTIASDYMWLLYSVTVGYVIVSLLYALPILFKTKSREAVIIMFAIISNLFTLVLFLAALIFIVACAQFVLERSISTLEGHAKKSLTMLTILCAIGGFGFLLRALYVLLRSSQAWSPDSIHYVFNNYYTFMLQNLVRAATLVILLPIGKDGMDNTADMLGDIQRKMSSFSMREAPPLK
jgi:hypothetical protein